MTEKFSSLIEYLKEQANNLRNKKVVVGFDGFIDSIVRVIKTKGEQQLNFFSSTVEFGNYVLEKSGSSFGLEMDVAQEKIGGNMPITAMAMSKLGADVTCIGALGYPAINPLFNELANNCTCYTLAEPGTATALEFNDGKIILSQMKQLNEVQWNTIKEIIGLDKLIDIFNSSHLYALLNWSEVAASSNILKGLLKDVLPNCINNKIAFFDLCDCSQRTDADIHEMLLLLKEFSKHCEVILSLNKNESRRIYEVLFNEKYIGNFEDIGTFIQQSLSLNAVVLHTSAFSIGYTKNNNYKASTFFIAQPLISTGAGDNFNAGFIIATLLDLSIKERLVFANATASLYMQNGISATIQETIEFLSNE